MKTPKFLALMVAALTLGGTAVRAQVGAGQAGDVVYSLPPTASPVTLTNNIYFYNGTFVGTIFPGATGGVTGDFPEITTDTLNVVNVGNPFTVQASSYGLLGLYVAADGATTNTSVYVGFSAASAMPINQSFTSFFAPFFNEHPDLSLDENTIVAALQNPDILDADTDDESGRVIYQFRDYVIGLSDSGTATAAPIDTGLLTLVHFGNGTAFEQASAVEIPLSIVPEPGTWALVLTAGGAGALAWGRRRGITARP